MGSLRLKAPFTDELAKKYGFEKSNGEDESDTMLECSAYNYCIGHSRRGQHYYILVDGTGLDIYASEPDGSGGAIELPSVLLDMFKDNLFE